ncbi:putative molybdenum carrier protein [Dermatobacter hominis]|uniref:putative molybdenum carrier protein n=1 Tax=Dermatobacter hominis TaxID=2884263 RepID=UPI001D12060B|nr:putative molybdenum carrier protein [Dermatobacter hominis]UDY36318.1 putative molybdenum carrier protein [Dermatobacter hominis]
MAPDRLTPVERVVSGAQTGVDQAALDVAIELGIPCGGWVPFGRRTEIGPAPDRYAGLVETDSAEYEVRTRRNVRDSDGTLVLVRSEPAGGSALTVDEAGAAGRPHLVVDLDGEVEADGIRSWIEGEGIRVLNVAGDRESTSPGIHDLAARLLRAVLARPPRPDGG